MVDWIKFVLITLLILAVIIIILLDRLKAVSVLPWLIAALALVIAFAIFIWIFSGEME